MQNDTIPTIGSAVSIGSYIAAINIESLQKLALAVAILSGLFSVANIIYNWLKNGKVKPEK